MLASGAAFGSFAMWFVNFVLVAAVLVSALVLGSAEYLERSATPSRVISGPIPLPTPRPTKLARELAPEREVVTEPKAAEAPRKAQRRTNARHATW